MTEGLARQGMDDELERLKAQLAERERLVAEKERQLEHYARDLNDTFKEERARSVELRDSYVHTVRALTNAVEARDAYTGKHAERVAAYGLELARVIDAALADDPQSEMGFLLHDIGKVAVPDGILHKKEALNAEERALMRTHPAVGWDILAGIPFLDAARAVVRHHHERWDGGGYPDGLAGEDIPLSARVFAVADALDAITTERPYRSAQSFAAARAAISAGSGSQFDPRMVDVLVSVSDETLERLRREIG
ncbi:MAG: HD domain-containing phosphohydrolase [Thermoleophilaceae bacterium]